MDSLTKETHWTWFLWHTSCITFFVAKKYQTQYFVNGGTEFVASHVRLPMNPISYIGVPPRAKKVHVPRRRLPVISFPEAACPVKIVHSVQKSDNVLPDTQPTQNQRV